MHKVVSAPRRAVATAVRGSNLLQDHQSCDFRSPPVRIFADNNSSSIAIVQSSTEFLVLFCHNLFLVIVCSVLFWQCWTKVKTRVTPANLASRADPVSAHGFAYHTTRLWLTRPCKRIFHHAPQINISIFFQCFSDVQPHMSESINTHIKLASVL